MPPDLLVRREGGVAYRRHKVHLYLHNFAPPPPVAIPGHAPGQFAIAIGSLGKN